MKNIHLQLRNLIGQIESGMIQTWVYSSIHKYTHAGMGIRRYTQVCTHRAGSRISNRGGATSYTHMWVWLRFYCFSHHPLCMCSLEPQDHR